MANHPAIAKNQANSGFLARFFVDVRRRADLFSRAIDQADVVLTRCIIVFRMYQVGAWLELLRGPRQTPSVVGWRALAPNVFFLGLTSLLTDISSEMVVAVLPMYLVGFLRLSPLQFGFVDGLYQGLGGIVQIIGGALSDRIRRHKEVAGLGYGVSALSRAGLMFSTQWTGISAWLAADRLGKGLRTAPRDALISMSAGRERLGLAFGIHRAMDAMGAMLGPILAFLILLIVRDGYRAVFVVSLAVAIVGVAVLGFFVENRDASEPSQASSSHRERDWRFLRDPRFRHLGLTTLVLSLVTISDAFVYLVLQERAGVTIAGFPLLYVGTSASYLLFAVPLGHVADRVGKFPVFIAGHALLLLLYFGLVSPFQGPWLAVVAVAMLGVYYAATEGVLMALGSLLIDEPVRAGGLAVLTTATAMARLASSVLFGLAWSAFGAETAVVAFGAALLMAILVCWSARPAATAFR
jgi:MFS family permease